MKRFSIVISIVVVSISNFTARAAAFCPNSDGPQGAVNGYLTTMSEYRFKDAYDFVSATMTDGKTREDWAGQQSAWYKGGEVIIFGKDIRMAHAIDDDVDCEKKAIVPNVLKSRDKFNTQGTTEFEYYITINDGDRWRVDSQETLFDAVAIKKWFPNDEVPDFRDGY